MIDLKNKIFSIEIISDSEIYFPDHVKDYLTKYADYLKNVHYDKQVISLIEKFSDNLYICLKEYFYGKHESAYYFFKRAVSFIDLKDTYSILEDTVFYRARKPKRNDEYSLFQESEMFHIPFQQRYKVKTQRYSYPGLPCLYLGSSIQVCCDELECWDGNLNIAQIDKQSSMNVGIVDLYFFEKYDFNNLPPEEEKKFIRLWPIVACCAFSYRDTKEMVFRPDYIIPQLLLEYVFDKNFDNAIRGVDTIAYGIRYRSVKHPLINDSDEQEKHEYNNYVFPALPVETSGFSKTLQQLFCVKSIFSLNERPQDIISTIDIVM